MRSQFFINTNKCQNTLCYLSILVVLCQTKASLGMETLKTTEIVELQNHDEKSTSNLVLKDPQSIEEESKEEFKDSSIQKKKHVGKNARTKAKKRNENRMMLQKKAEAKREEMEKSEQLKYAVICFQYAAEKKALNEKCEKLSEENKLAFSLRQINRFFQIHSERIEEHSYENIIDTLDYLEKDDRIYLQMQTIVEEYINLQKRVNALITEFETKHKQPQDEISNRLNSLNEELEQLQKNFKDATYVDENRRILERKEELTCLTIMEKTLQEALENPSEKEALKLIEALERTRRFKLKFQELVEKDRIEAQEQEKSAVKSKGLCSE